MMSRKVLYKVGGSLLDMPDLFKQLYRLLEVRFEEKRLLVMGGGKAADLVRYWDEKFSLTEEQAHQLALSAMKMNADLAYQKLPESLYVTSQEVLELCWKTNSVPILSADLFLSQEEAESEFLLPHSWDCTSDAIAAWCAIHLKFDELRFLKSVPAPDFEELMDPSSEILDPVVRDFLPRIPVISWCNLRESRDVVTIKHL